MSDTYSTNLKVRLPQTGAYDETWGDLHNADTTQLLDEAIAGQAAYALTTTSYAIPALSDGLTSDSRKLCWKFTGAPGGTCTVTVPATVVRGLHLIDNQSSNQVDIKYATGATASVAAGARDLIWCSGTDCYLLT